MTSVDSSKDRIIIPDQAQRRSNLDEVKVQRDAWSRPSGTRIFVPSIHTRTYIGGLWVCKWCKSVGGK